MEGGGGKFYDESDGWFDDYLEDLDVNDTNAVTAPEKIFTILSQEDIRQHIDDEIMYTAYLLKVSRDAATLLLCKYNWNVDTLHQEWFDDQEKTLKASGLVSLEEKNPILDATMEEFSCGICLQNHAATAAVPATCGHIFCKTCWRTYVSKSINDCGFGCLTLRCPQPSCGTGVGRSVVRSLASEEDTKTYDNYLISSYVEGNKNTKWCPAPGCDYAVEFVIGNGGITDGGSKKIGGNIEVSCNCSYRFCWNCLGEAHSPLLDCEAATEWTGEGNELETENWILDNTKPCPQCKRPIEKATDVMGENCDHMTCVPPCEFEFCWQCLRPWSDHIGTTWGFKAFVMCSEEQRKRGKRSLACSEEEKERKRAKRSLENHRFYFDTWILYEYRRRRDLEDLHQLQTVHLENLARMCGETTTMLKFIVDAWTQIVEHRRVLKWMYAYRSYLSEGEHKKNEFLESMQGFANSALETLHKYARKNLFELLEPKCPSEKYKLDGFRTKLIGLTNVTRIHFDNLVRTLENEDGLLI